MEIELRKICDDLENIRIDIRKLGKRKYEALGYKKLNLAKNLYATYKKLLFSFNDPESLNLEHYILDILCDKIEKIYNRILDYFKHNNSVETDKESLNMAKFDLKSACNLIPVMDGNEETVEKIIEGIELLNSMWADNNCKMLLISFVLKTRLNKTAKLKLATKYESAESLIRDIKQNLLTKKSATSLLIQLNNVSQNDMPLDEYSNKIEDLFVNLTISQSDSNNEAHAILRPINEALAIKKFADGLRNKRLGTIIAARNYLSLKDAVRAAKDEESVREESVMTYFGRGQARNNRGMRGSYRGRSTGYYNNRTRGYQNNNVNRYYQNNTSDRYQKFNYGRNFRGPRHYFRGPSRQNPSGRGRGLRRVFTCGEPQETRKVETERTEVGGENEESGKFLSDFFRE